MINTNIIVYVDGTKHRGTIMQELLNINAKVVKVHHEANAVYAFLQNFDLGCWVAVGKANITTKLESFPEKEIPAPVVVNVEDTSARIMAHSNVKMDAPVENLVTIQDLVSTVSALEEIKELIEEKEDEILEEIVELSAATEELLEPISVIDEELLPEVSVEEIELLPEPVVEEIVEEKQEVIEEISKPSEMTSVVKSAPVTKSKKKSKKR